MLRTAHTTTVGNRRINRLAPVPPFPARVARMEKITMIIKELGPEHIGRWVDYRDGAGQIEKGRIKSWNDRVVSSCTAAQASGTAFF